ncbi:MAG: hypothetical protein ACRC57_10505 [Sarcina sp.]
MLIIFMSKNNKVIEQLNPDLNFAEITPKRFSYKIFKNNITYKSGTRLNTICFDIDNQKFLWYGKSASSNYYCAYETIKAPYLSLIIQLILSIIFIYLIYLGLTLGNIYIGVGAILTLPLLITYIHVKNCILLGKKSLKEDA